MTNARLTSVTDRDWRSFLGGDLAVLTLSVSSCPVCADWHRELSSWDPATSGWPSLAIGTVMLDSPDTSEFKRANDWLDLVPGLPFTAIFVEGEPVSSFAGTGVGRLQERLRRLGERTPSTPGASSPDSHRASRATTD